jgi:hypothetical protein
MGFREAADWVSQNPYTFLGVGWGVTVLACLVKFEVLPRLQPKQPVKHGPEYLASKAKADASMARLFGKPKEP